MPASSAGVLMYRRAGKTVEVLLVHPGGPFWRNKDAGAWSIPKGEIEPGEDPVDVARREFQEELGTAAGQPLRALGEIRQRGGKRVIAFAVEGNLDADAIASNTFEMEWPPKSGRRQSFPEVDRAAWFDLKRAREKILASQQPLLDRLDEAQLSQAAQLESSIRVGGLRESLQQPSDLRRLERIVASARGEGRRVVQTSPVC